MMSGDGAARRRNILMAGGLTAAGALAASPAAQAANITVTSSSDSLGTGSLRDALIEADTTPGGDRILFSSAVTGDTITLTSELPHIEESLEIVGPGADKLTISGNDAHRIFAAGGHGDLLDVSIEGLTLSHGYLDQVEVGGAAIHAEFTDLALNGMRIIDNHSVNHSVGDLESTGAILANESTVTIANSILAANSADGGTASGGAVFVDGDPDPGNDLKLTISNSTISGNSAAGTEASGGGIATRIPTTISDSTISGNETSGYFTGGGGISAGNAPLTVNRSTVSGNSARGSSAARGGGMAMGQSTLTTNRVTITGNTAKHGGGISGTWVETPFALKNTIVADNTASQSGPDLLALSDEEEEEEASFELAYSLIGDTSGANASTTHAVPGSNLLNADPNLAPLADNGGPTRTHALLGGSPAINRGATGGAAACTGADQRGVPRQGRCDIGAYELARCAGTPVNRFGTAGNDVLRGTGGRDGFLGFAGNDRLFGFAGNDAFCAGPGSDRVFGGPGADRAFGQRGFDRLFGGAQRDFLFGGGQGDRLFGQRGSDRLFGGRGRDLLVGGSQRDLLRPGPGRDRTRQ